MRRSSIFSTLAPEITANAAGGLMFRSAKRFPAIPGLTGRSSPVSVLSMSKAYKRNASSSLSQSPSGRIPAFASISPKVTDIALASLSSVLSRTKASYLSSMPLITLLPARSARRARAFLDHPFCMRSLFIKSANAPVTGRVILRLPSAGEEADFFAIR